MGARRCWRRSTWEVVGGIERRWEVSGGVARWEVGEVGEKKHGNCTSQPHRHRVPFSVRDHNFVNERLFGAVKVC